MVIEREYDIIVLGGGAAGVAAAIGAAQAGASCLLVERNGSLGGQATNANVASYCGFYTHGKEPLQVVKGVGQMVLDELQKLGGCQFRLSSAQNAIITFDEEKLKFTLDRLVSRWDNLHLLLHCRCVGAVTDPTTGAVQAIRCMDDEQSYLFRAKSFVDASGDGNLAHLAGAHLRFGNGSGSGYMSTRVMRLDHVAPEASFKPDVLKKAFEQAKADGYDLLTKVSGIVFRTAPDTAYAILPSVAVPSLDAETLTRCEINTRAQSQQYEEAFRRYLPGMENCRLVSTGHSLGLRDTRHLIGEYTLSSHDVLEAVKQPDGVACGAWPCEMHTKLEEMPGYLWVKDDDYYHIPLRCLHSENIPNLWGAGRLVSADPIAFASVRVMGIGFGTGQAAGVAAAQQALSGKVDAQTVRQELIRQGAFL